MSGPMLDDVTRSVVLAFAAHQMRAAPTARALHMHRNTVLYRLGKARRKTGLDPFDFFQLVRLVELCRRREGAE